MTAPVSITHSSSSTDQDSDGKAQDNAALREEVRRLQLALVDKFRGKGKSIGGSQFRASSARRNSPGAETERSSELANLRVLIKGLKRDCAELRTAKAEANRRCSTLESAKAEVDRRLAEERVTNEMQMQRLREELNALRAQQAQPSPEPETSVFPAEPPRQQRASNSSLEPRMSLDGALAEELSELRRRLAAEEQARSAAHERQLVAEDGLTRSEQARDRDRAEAGHVQARLQGELEALQQTLAEERKLRNDAKSGAEDARRRLLAELESLRVALGKAKADAEARRRDRDRAVAEERRAREALAASQTTLRSQATQLAELERQYEVLRREVQDGARARRQAEDDASKARRDLEVAHGDLEVKTRALAEAEDCFTRAQREFDAAIQAKKDENSTLAALNEQLQTDKTKLLERQKEVEERMLEQVRRHKRALENAMNSIVRLCVVAPTVNVHMGDQTQMFKAPFPQHKLKSFVEGQVLPQFSKIFVQDKEGCAPEGEPLDEWLQGLLGEMQGTIERHLTKVFSEVRM